MTPGLQVPRTQVMPQPCTLYRRHEQAGIWDQRRLTPPRPQAEAPDAADKSLICAETYLLVCVQRLLMTLPLQWQLQQPPKPAEITCAVCSAPDSQAVSDPIVSSPAASCRSWLGGNWQPRLRCSVRAEHPLLACRCRWWFCKSAPSHSWRGVGRGTRRRAPHLHRMQRSVRTHSEAQLRKRQKVQDKHRTLPELEQLGACQERTQVGRVRTKHMHRPRAEHMSISTEHG